MSSPKNEMIGYARSHTPLSLLYAANYHPHRRRPLTECQDRAELHPHDNLCPHVKRILDRAMGDDLSEHKGRIFMNCCDATRNGGIR